VHDLALAHGACRYTAEWRKVLAVLLGERSVQAVPKRPTSTSAVRRGRTPTHARTHLHARTYARIRTHTLCVYVCPQRRLRRRGRTARSKQRTTSCAPSTTLTRSSGSERRLARPPPLPGASPSLSVYCTRACTPTHEPTTRLWALCIEVRATAGGTGGPHSAGPCEQLWSRAARHGMPASSGRGTSRIHR
jgi:hypothetical protein